MVTASLVAPGYTDPGQAVVLDASASTADLCPGGPLLFRFWADADDDGVLGNSGDILLRGWTDDPVLVDVPQETTLYGVEVRCSSSADCNASASALVTVGSGMVCDDGDPCNGVETCVLGSCIPGEPWDCEPVTVCWQAQPGATLYEIARSTSPGFETCFITSSSEPCITDSEPMAPGDLAYFLLRAVAPVLGSWGDGSVERPDACPGAFTAVVLTEASPPMP